MLFGRCLRCLAILYTFKRNPRNEGFFYGDVCLGLSDIDKNRRRVAVTHVDITASDGKGYVMFCGRMRTSVLYRAKGKKAD